MEVALLANTNIPKDAILSVRAGTVRRQAGIDSGRPFRFPTITPEMNPLKIDILKQVASTYLVMKPNEDQYKVSFSGGEEAQGMTCEVQIKAADGSAIEAAPKDEGEESETAKEAKEYLESHGILPFVQALLQTVIKERPVDPYAYMARHFMSGYHPLDTKASKPQPQGDASAPTSPMGGTMLETMAPPVEPVVLADPAAAEMITTAAAEEDAAEAPEEESSDVAASDVAESEGEPPEEVDEAPADEPQAEAAAPEEEAAPAAGEAAPEEEAVPEEEPPAE